MPAPTKKDPDAFECWPIKKPVLYTVGAARACRRDLSANKPAAAAATR